MKFKNIKEVEDYAANIDDIELKSALKINEEYGNKIQNLKQLAQKYFYDKRGEINTFLTTAHVSKGLEWDKVIIADDFPDFAKKISESKYSNIAAFKRGIHKVDPLIVNEFNLFYVAVTRAKQKLIINSINEEYLNMTDKDFNEVIKEFATKKKKVAV